MNIITITGIAIIVAVPLGFLTNINIGLYAFAFAYLIGCYGLGMSPKAITGLLPTQIFYLFFVVAFFYSFTTEDGRLELISKMAFYATRKIPPLAFLSGMENPSRQIALKDDYNLLARIKHHNNGNPMNIKTNRKRRENCQKEQIKQSISKEYQNISVSYRMETGAGQSTITWRSSKAMGMESSRDFSCTSSFWIMA